MAQRVRTVETRDQMEDLIDDYITRGYTVQEQGDRTVMLRKEQWGSFGGHLFVALLTVWFTGGVGNLIYAISSHYMAEKVLLKTKEKI